MPDIDYWLGRKYALLQQQADATTQNAATNAMGTSAAAAVDLTRAKLMPGESFASIGKAKADTNLTNVQASLLPAETAANIARMRSGANLDDVQATTLRAGPGLRNPFTGAMLPIMGPAGYTGFRLSSSAPTSSVYDRFGVRRVGGSADNNDNLRFRKVGDGW